MNHTLIKLSWMLLIGVITVMAAVMAIQPGYAQTNLQELQNRVAELEAKLVDAKARQEKAYKVQMQLEEQEQALARFEKSEKYRVAVIEIRSDIKNIRTRIESIIKEKNDLEENLRIAKNLQAILRDAQNTAKPETKTRTDITTRPPAVQTKTPDPQGLGLTVKPPVKTGYAPEKATGWRIISLQIDSQFSYEEQKEILKIFVKDRYLSQDDVLNGAYQIYKDTGAILHFKISAKSQDGADFNILFNQREARNSNYGANSSLSFMPTVKTLNEFKKDHFQMTMKND